MKKWIFMLLLAGSIQGIYAQKTEKKEKFNPNTPLFEELTDVKKKTDKFNLYLNMQGSFDAHFQNGFQEGDFNMHFVSKPKEISTTGCLTAIVSASTARTMQTA